MLPDLAVLVVDCQASGATPRLGSLLELGWTLTGPGDQQGAVDACWITPPEGTRVSRPVRQLTGWSEACLPYAVAPAEAWSRVLAQVGRAGRFPAPCVAHFARFELAFLDDLHQRHGQGQPFPLDTVCLHEIARRLYPELPRRGLRALAGYLGHSPELVRRSAGHVEASAFIWKALLPALEAAGVQSWEALKQWMQVKAPPRRRLSYPFPASRRRALPGQPGVYRFVRRNGDVLYVGKAANLKKRVASHFTHGAHATERALEMLTQVNDVDVTPAETVLEAALLETDEIKRLHPPYNVQLRVHDRRAWFVSAQLTDAAAEPDAVHRVGPLPSPRALSNMAAIRALAEGGDVRSDSVRAAAVGVPPPWAPDESLFVQAWQQFCADHLGPHPRSPWHALLRASKRLAHTGVADGPEDSPPEGWDLDRVKRHLDRALLRGGQLYRRARWLVLLSDASIAFREHTSTTFRLLVLDRGEVVERRDLGDPYALPERDPCRPWRQRQATIDAARYDRLRVLATELARVRSEGGAAFVRIGRHLVSEPRAGRLVGW